MHLSQHLPRHTTNVYVHCLDLQTGLEMCDAGGGGPLILFGLIGVGLAEGDRSKDEEGMPSSRWKVIVF
jgi:hypothetical protein